MWGMAPPLQAEGRSKASSRVRTRRQRTQAGTSVDLNHQGLSLMTHVPQLDLMPRRFHTLQKYHTSSEFLSRVGFFKAPRSFKELSLLTQRKSIVSSTHTSITAITF